MTHACDRGTTIDRWPAARRDCSCRLRRRRGDRGARAIAESRLLGGVAGLTVAELKRILLSPAAAGWIRRYRSALRSEVIAAIVKVMTTGELSIVARRLFNPHPGEGPPSAHRSTSARASSPTARATMTRRFCSRSSKGSPTAAATSSSGSTPRATTSRRSSGSSSCFAGRPAAGAADPLLRALGHRQAGRARARTRGSTSASRAWPARRRASPAWSASTSTASLDLGARLRRLLLRNRPGTAVTNGAAEGVDMVTLEAAAYGVARHIQPRRPRAWMIVNDVAGFIGPEVFRTAEQLERACLEDIVMAKLHGLTMGLDVCATFHMGIDPAALCGADRASSSCAAPAYLMAVAGNADPMLGYLTTSFREHPRLRRHRAAMTSPMRQRLAGARRPGAGRERFAIRARRAGPLRSMPPISRRAAIGARSRRCGGRTQRRSTSFGRAASTSGMVTRPGTRRGRRCAPASTRSMPMPGQALYARMDDAVVATRVAASH